MAMTHSAPRHGATAVLLALSILLPLAEARTVHGQQPSSDLVSMFELGALVADTNGDSVPDFVRGALVLGSTPTVAEQAAAAEIAARLGFETMAMNLPMARGADSGVPIVIGRGGLAASGLTRSGIDPASLDSGEGVVSVVEVDGRPWVLVVGGDDPGLLAAARLFAGVLPHTRTLSTSSLDGPREDLARSLEAAGLSGSTIDVLQARARDGQDGITLLVLAVRGVDADRAAAALDYLRDPNGSPPAPEAADSTATYPERPLNQVGLQAVEVRLEAGGVLRLPGRAAPDPPGPISGRPGSGGKNDLDLSNLYTGDGLLGGSPIPSRVDAVLVPGGDGISALPDLAARLGLEATGLTVPLVRPAADVARPAGQPVMVLAGAGNSLTGQLIDSARVDPSVLAPGEGLVEIVPDAFGSKSALVVTGDDAAGAERALAHVATTFPNLAERGKDRPTIDDVERDLWDALSGHAPVGQAAIGLYKFDRIAAKLDSIPLQRARVLLSVEKADPGLGPFVARTAAERLGLDEVEVHIDNRDVQHAAPILEETVTLPSEVERFRQILRQTIVPGVEAGRPVEITARLSEPPDMRAMLEEEALEALLAAGAEPSATRVEILSAFKQGFSWLHERIQPQLEGQPVGEVVIRFRRNEAPEAWPQQAIQTPVRWLHEIFPIAEVMARDLRLDLAQVRFEETEDGPTYEVIVTDPSGAELLSDSFEPAWVLRPYFDRFRDYEQVRVTTGWIRARVGEVTTVDERIATDPELFWDHFQAHVLPAAYDHVMRLHEGLPRGGSDDAPFFGELVVELEMSEPDFRLDIDNEIHATLDALHEEIYFGTIEFFDLLGRNARGQGITFPGRIVPIMRPKSDGTPPVASIRLTGFETSRPAVVVGWEARDGRRGEHRLDISKTGLERPSARQARVATSGGGLSRLAFRVRVDTEADLRDSLITRTRELSVDESIVSAEQVVATVEHVEHLRAAGLYTHALAFPGLDTIEVWAEWTHKQDPDARRTAVLAPNGSPPELPDWRALLPEDWSWNGERIVQWDTPIPPDEGHRMLAQMAATFDEATMYRVGGSYLGRDIWALDLMRPIEASHWSHMKATTFKPTVVYSARQHANEVSSTSHVLRHAELLLTDPDERAKLDRVNVVVHPFTNPDGAQTAYDLYRITPDYILHAGYLGPLGQDATSGGNADHPIYPESTVRGRLWETWLPDIFLNPHGYPSHQVVQLFSEYTGLVRRGRVTERNWGFNKGWFMPGFGYVDNPQFPRHKDAAFEILDYITRGINSNRDVFEFNQKMYERYRRYGADYDDDVFNLPMMDSVLIEMPLRGSSGRGGGYDANITIWSGTTEAPDETAYGPYLELVAKAGLSWDQALTNYLVDGDHEVKRSGSRFFDGVTLRLDRPRPPEKESDEDQGEEEGRHP